MCCASPEPFVARYGTRDFVLVTGRVEPRKNQLMLLLALREAGLPVVVAGAQVHQGYLDLCRRVAPPETNFVGRLEPDMLASARAAAKAEARTKFASLDGRLNEAARAVGLALAWRA